MSFQFLFAHKQKVKHDFPVVHHQEEVRMSAEILLIEWQSRQIHHQSTSEIFYP